MTDVVDDPRYPDRIGAADGPMIPCKVVEIVATTAPANRRPRPGGTVVYDGVQQYRIRYEPPPVPESPAVERTVVGPDAAIRAKLASWGDDPCGYATCIVIGYGEMRGALLAVLELHAADEVGFCRECSEEFPAAWPCPTLLAVAKALGVEVDGAREAL